MLFESTELLYALHELYEAERRKLHCIKTSEATAQIARVRAFADVIEFIILNTADFSAVAKWRIAIIGKKSFAVCSKCGTVHFNGQLPQHCNGCGAKML